MCELGDGTELAPSAARRLACDAEIIPAVLGGSSEVLDVGRQRRTATRAQRRALRAMYRTCAWAGCDRRFDHCQIHHVRWWWEHHGQSDLDNLLPLCHEHHHRVHEGGWRVQLAPDRTLTITPPERQRC